MFFSSKCSLFHNSNIFGSSIIHISYTGCAKIDPLTSNDTYRGRTAPLNSKRCILHIYSTNIGTEYFKHGIYSPCFSLQNAVCFIILTYLVPVLFTFYIQSVLKIKKIIQAPKRLMQNISVVHRVFTNVGINAAHYLERTVEPRDAKSSHSCVAVLSQSPH